MTIHDKLARYSNGRPHKFQDQIRILIDALKQWKCPSCGGTRRYRGYSKTAPNGGPCRKCAQTEGLHETAFEALQKVRAK